MGIPWWLKRFWGWWGHLDNLLGLVEWLSRIASLVGTISLLAYLLNQATGVIESQWQWIVAGAMLAIALLPWIIQILVSRIRGRRSTGSVDSGVLFRPVAMKNYSFLTITNSGAPQEFRAMVTASGNAVWKDLMRSPYRGMWLGPRGTVPSTQEQKDACVSKRLLTGERADLALVSLGGKRVKLWAPEAPGGFYIADREEGQLLDMTFTVELLRELDGPISRTFRITETGLPAGDQLAIREIGQEAATTPARPSEPISTRAQPVTLSGKIVEAPSRVRVEEDSDGNYIRLRITNISNSEEELEVKFSELHGTAEAETPYSARWRETELSSRRLKAGGYDYINVAESLGPSGLLTGKLRFYTADLPLGDGAKSYYFDREIKFGWAVIWRFEVITEPPLENPLRHKCYVQMGKDGWVVEFAIDKSHGDTTGPPMAI